MKSLPTVSLRPTFYHISEFMFKKLMRKPIVLFCMMLVEAITCAAQGKVADYYAQAGKANLASLWHAPKIYFVGAPNPWDTFPEPIGFIGSNYQRFYIHYTSVVKDVKNSYQYNVQGKTRVKNNICSFSGTITVKQAKRNLEPNMEYPQYKYGYLICEVNIKENPKQAGSGTIKGKMTTNWYINKQGQLAYDTLIPEDGFSNNECAARWTPYNGGASKTCNWGDFRIPESGSLDTGAGEFYVNEKYINNGWQNYMEAKLADVGKPKGKKALAEEKRPWWQ
ncbi:hypothetical protein HH214_15700 [Mucilaginibacter robiniae]|uniref:Uncharacterized protein n=1 Tax=Mucilaginibacter robiniae TaxID=2728022 RepID=A0A7L5E1E9_9SPHI|nr:hypothetical protein [Mucilaginibacter robiniae]QJD97210.1 hypothetical protein HH214_15700 [Mucilaginibacter robiniae]